MLRGTRPLLSVSDTVAWHQNYPIERRWQNVRCGVALPAYLHCLQVGDEVIGLEVCAAKAYVDIALLVGAVLHLAALEVLDSLRQGQGALTLQHMHSHACRGALHCSKRYL